jgi:hypothetical protein
MGISHGNRGNTVLHIVIGEGGRGSEGLSLKIRPYVEDLFLAYLLVSNYETTRKVNYDHIM